MESTTIVEVGTGVGAVLTGLGLIGSLFYPHNQNRAERILSDERWAKLKSESDDRWAALSSKTDEQFRNSDERWAKLLESYCDFKNISLAQSGKTQK